MKAIVALISHVPNPRANRRLEQMAEHAPVELIFWNKGGVSCDLQEINNVNQQEIQIPANRTNPLKRIRATLKFRKIALNRMKQLQPKIVYAERFDMLFIAWSYYISSKYKPRIIYEVPDLPSLMVDKRNGIKTNLIYYAIRFLERIIYKSVTILIVTSELFYEGYFHKYISKDKKVYMPNIPDLTAFRNYNYTKSNKDEFTIGFIGVVRYKKQIDMLLEASVATNTNVLLAGFTEDCFDLEHKADKMPNVERIGKYNYENDIAMLYNKCDVIYSVYDASMLNVRIALPNKLYESIYCRIPIIVAKETYLGKLVEELNVGVAVDSNDNKDLIEAINKLKLDNIYYSSLVNSCKNHLDFVNDNNSKRELSNKIKKILEEDR